MKIRENGEKFTILMGQWQNESADNHGFVSAKCAFIWQNSKTLSSFFVVVRCFEKKSFALATTLCLLLYSMDNGIFLRISSSSYYDIHYKLQMKTHLVSYPFSFHNNGNAFIRFFHSTICFDP